MTLNLLKVQVALPLAPPENPRAATARFILDALDAVDRWTFKRRRIVDVEPLRVFVRNL